MKKWLCITVALLLTLSGCTTGVSQEEYDKVRDGLAEVQEECDKLRTDLAKAQEECDEVRGDLTEAQAEIATLQSDLAQLQSGTASLIVASSDSLDSSKSRAGYICDGSDDQVEINAAIDALPDSGGKVLLLEGEYKLSAPIKLFGSYQTLEGVGDSTKITLQDAAFHKVALARDATQGDTVIHLTTITPSLYANHSVYLSDAVLTHQYGVLRAIVSVDSTANTITIDEGLPFAITVAQSAYAFSGFPMIYAGTPTLYDPTDLTSRYGLSIRNLLAIDDVNIGLPENIGMADMAVVTTFGVINGNIEGCTFKGKYYHIVDLDGWAPDKRAKSNDIIFSNNHVISLLTDTGQPNRMIHLSDYLEDVIIDNNTIVGSGRDYVGQYGVFFCFAGRSVVSNNIIRDVGVGVRLIPLSLGTVVSGNQVKGVDAFVRSDYGLKNVTIVGNSVEDAKYGIDVDYKVDSCVISDNRLEGDGSAESVGIRVGEPPDAVLEWSRDEAKPSVINSNIITNFATPFSIPAGYPDIAGSNAVE